VFAVLRSILNPERQSGAVLAGLSKDEFPSAPVPRTPSRSLTDAQVSKLIENSGEPESLGLPDTRIGVDRVQDFRAWERVRV
jgi:hypothetical protein